MDEDEERTVTFAPPTEYHLHIILGTRINSIFAFSSCSKTVRS